jgi:outer membrane receptor protein involved in Fe transport
MMSATERCCHRQLVGPTLSALLLLVLPAADAASAREAEQLFDLPMDDLLALEIRSAGKRDEEIRDIPASVTVLTREEIERYGWVTFEELLRNVPGFFVLDTLDEQPIGTRGVAGGSALILVNGIPQNRAMQLILPVESIDRVEIIRGPMSVIYGDNAFLGVINVRTNDIGRHGPRVSLGAGSRKSAQAFARLGTEGDDRFIVLNAGAYRTDGLDGAYADMLGPEQLAALDPRMHRSMDGDMDRQDLSLDLSAGWGDWVLDARWTRRHAGFYVLTPSFDDGNRGYITDWSAAVGWERALSDTLGLRARVQGNGRDIDVDELDFLTPELDGRQESAFRRWETELNLLWKPTPELDLLAGYRYQQFQDIGNRLVALPVADVTEAVSDFGSHDLFADLAWDASERLRLTGGVRWSLPTGVYRYRLENRSAGTRIDETRDKDERNLVTGRVAALWSLDQGQVLKAIWGTSARDNEDFRFIEPERIETAELVYVQTRPRWGLTASLFQNQVSNLLRFIQRVDPDTGLFEPETQTDGEWRTRGLELIGELRPRPDLNLSAGLTLQRTEDRETDLEPGYSPRLLGYLKADYRRGPLTYAAYARYVGGLEADYTEVEGPDSVTVERLGERVDGEWDLGLNLRYRHPGTGLYANLNVSNLLDAEIRYPAKDLADFERGLIGPGRVVTVTLGWAFWP